MVRLQGVDFDLEFTEAARRLWLQINQVCRASRAEVCVGRRLDILGRSHILSRMNTVHAAPLPDRKSQNMQINAFGSDCHAGGQPLYEIFTEAVQLLQQLQYSPYPLVPFSPKWCSPRPTSLQTRAVYWADYSFLLCSPYDCVIASCRRQGCLQDIEQLCEPDRLISHSQPDLLPGTKGEV